MVRDMLESNILVWSGARFWTCCWKMFVCSDHTSQLNTFPGFVRSTFLDLLLEDVCV